MPPSPVLVEALAFQRTIGLASQLGFRRVCFETDYLQLFQRWKKPPYGNSYLILVVRECISLCRLFDFAILSFVCRSVNAIADFIARRVSSFAGLVWIEGVPTEVNSYVSMDVSAFMPVQV